MKGALLTLVTVLLCLVLGEIGFRVLDGWSLAHVRLVKVEARRAAASADATKQWPVAQRHLANLPHAAGVDRAWFNDNPPEPASAARPISEARKRAQLDYLRRGVYAPQSDYVWNSAFVANNASPSWAYFFTPLPEKLDTFDAVDGQERPVYRFPPNEHLPSGLLTNRYGWRGDDLHFTRDPRRVLIAFVGASTTQDLYTARFSHSELVGYWLNRWAESCGAPLRFDIINAGREGINSQDIAAIVEQEIRPMRPDFIVYLEGSNQTGAYRNLVRMADGGPIPPFPAPTSTKPANQPTSYSAILARVQRAAAVARAALTEPAKPAYRLQRETLTTAGIRRGNYHGLPLNLDVICGDLERIREVATRGGGQLFISSFTWFDPRGIPLDADRHRFIHAQLNQSSWPLSYKDWHELMAFQNEAFAAFAETRGAGFLDVDRHLPRDPDLFIDPIHVTEEGARVRGWVVFNLLLPHVERAWRAGQLPRGPSDSDFEYGAVTLRSRPMQAKAVVATSPTAAPLPGDLKLARLDQFTSSDPGAEVVFRNQVLVVTTGNTQWARAAAIPLMPPPANLAGAPLEIDVHLRVTGGSIGVGLLRTVHPDTYQRRIVDAANGETHIQFIRDPALPISHLLIENALGEGKSSVEILGVSVRKI